MSRGTSGGCWSGKSAQSVLKHAILKRYIPVFGGTTGSAYGRVVYLDGLLAKGARRRGARFGGIDHADGYRNAAASSVDMRFR